MKRKARGSCGKSRHRETPQELATRRLPAGRGKRVPAAEINQQENQCTSEVAA
ncbi:hypothetical protein [Heyndrickxia acidicola]|uniref:Uncharacterized protein n=1 Tax=Heyndrickxia acidicola TaxID=209389 RepID=A0ABU6MCD4_9BACI|nr:hypothetical protein [Heyndrickxia acidicola]MED1202175.1 hypothetical protein [Heyndrickxia acidicola]